MDVRDEALFDDAPNELLPVLRGQIGDEDWDAGLVAVARPIDWDGFGADIVECCGEASMSCVQFEGRHARLPGRCGGKACRSRHVL